MPLPNRANPPERDPESGAILALVLILSTLITFGVLSLGMLTRTNTQIVTAIENVNEAFVSAESGLVEAVRRLELPSPSPVTTTDGNTFNAAIRGKGADVNWQAQIRFDVTTNATSGSIFSTPTIQGSANRIPYSGGTNDAPLRISWALAPGGGTPTILRLPDGRRVLQIDSTGREGPARQRVQTRVAVRPGGPPYLTVDEAACPGIEMSGGTAVDFEGGPVHSNATCTCGISTGNNSSVENESDDGFSVQGSSCGNASPTPESGAPFIPDPFFALAPPANADGPCTETRTVKQVLTQVGVISPGVHCGNWQITGNDVYLLRPGIYVIAGGKFSLGGGSVMRIDTTAPPSPDTGTGVMFYLTDTIANPSPSNQNAYTAPEFGPGDTDLWAPTLGPYAGILFFMDRDNHNRFSFSGNFTEKLDGVVYAVNSELEISGSHDKNLNIHFVVKHADLQASGAINFLPPSYSPLDSETGGKKGYVYDQLAWVDS